MFANLYNKDEVFRGLGWQCTTAVKNSSYIVQKFDNEIAFLILLQR